MQPKWLQTPTTINHSGFKTLSSSFWGSLSLFKSTFLASFISFFVLCLIKTGFPLHLTVLDDPSSILDKSNSFTPYAKTSADGFIESINGHTANADPTAAIEVVVNFKKFLLSCFKLNILFLLIN